MQKQKRKHDELTKIQNIFSLNAQIEDSFITDLNNEKERDMDCIKKNG
jgi:hypothetical protein